MPIPEDDAVTALAALGNLTRLRLFRLLVRAGRDGRNVGDLQQVMGIPASTLAHHLTTLARAGLIVQARRGREVLSAADYAAVQGLTDFLTGECCAGVAAAAPDLLADPPQRTRELVP